VEDYPAAAPVCVWEALAKSAESIEELAVAVQGYGNGKQWSTFFSTNFKNLRRLRLNLRYDKVPSKYDVESFIPFLQSLTLLEGIHLTLMHSSAFWIDFKSLALPNLIDLVLIVCTSLAG